MKIVRASHPVVNLVPYTPWDNIDFSHIIDIVKIDSTHKYTRTGAGETFSPTVRAGV